MKTPDDGVELDDLLRRWRDGDGAAGEAFFAHWFPRLIAFFRHKVADDELRKSLDGRLEDPLYDASE